MTTTETLLARLDLERIDRDLFRGHSPKDGRPMVFGGQVAAQSLVAAVRTTESNRPVHSLHAYFLRPGSPEIPIIYRVDRIRDGTSFTTRRVVAVQDGEAIFNMSASFQVETDGPSHQRPMPEVPPPEEVPSNDDRIREGLESNEHPFYRFIQKLELPIEHRDLDPLDPARPTPKPGPHHVWFRARDRLPDDLLIHQCALTYASDFYLLESSLRHHGLTWFDPAWRVASLDHVVWFHRPFRADEWLLYDVQSPNTGGARGLNFGHIHRRDGTLIASVAQEGLMRPRAKR
ncbi:MAG: acyl-CoA thioesterase II [Myxococcales bacterium]|nr:acyl-CoA thioesterase II [Myxococcales bacterium]